MKSTNPRCLVLIVLACLWTSVAGQLPDYHLQLFDYTYGIRPGNIFDLEKDAQGFLWVLYPRSIQRFDGKQVHAYKPGDNLENVVCDQDGRLWITSPDKIFLYKPDLEVFEEVGIDPGDTTVVKGTVFPLGNELWLVTNKGFFEFQESQQLFTSVLPGVDVGTGLFTRVFASYDSTLFFMHDGYVFRYQIESGAVDSLPFMNSRRLFPLSPDSLLVNTWSLDSYWFDFNKGTITEAVLPVEMRDPMVATLSVRSLVEASSRKYLIAAREGIYKYDNQAKTFKNLRLYYNGSPIVTRDFTNNITYDEEGYIWMATVDGIARFALRGQSFGLMRFREMDENLPVGIDNIRGITEDKNKNLWLATGNGFVCWERDKDLKKIFLPDEQSTDKLAYPSVRGIAYDGKYIILAPADQGLWLFDPEKETYRRPDYASEAVENTSKRDFFDAVTTLQNGDHLLLGRDAIYVLEHETYTLRFLDIPAGKENSNYAYQAPNGEIWITTMKGLHLLDADLRYLQKVELLTSEKFISSGTFLPDGKLLFATSDGLFTAFHDQGQVTVQKYTDLFDNTFIATLYIDDNGILWVTSDEGIYRFDPKQSKVNLYDYSDNVQGYGFNGNSYLKSSDGILFFGGINGLNYLIPGNFASREDSLKVYIQSVRSGVSDSVKYALDQEVQLRYTQRALEVEFVCPYFNNPDKVKYRYQIEGLDDQWHYTGSNDRVRFTSFPAGKFRLLLEASINQADWFRAQNTFSFRVMPPFWFTWWFILLGTGALVTALWLFIRNRNQRIQEKQEELEAEQAINYFSSRMGESQSMEQLLWDVARNCIGRLQFEYCVISLVDDTKNALVQVAAHGPKSPGTQQILKPIEVPVGQGICGTVAQTGVAELIPDTSVDARYVADDVHRLSEIVVPIMSGGRVLGVINCEHSKKRFFTQRHLSILTTIASLCAARIIKSKAEAEKSEAEKMLMETKQQMADVEMQALRAQMNPHFIFNCLNSINRYIVKSDQATASLYLTRFAKLIRLILDNSNSKTVTLTNELEALRLYIEMETIRFEKQFTCTITIDEEVHPDHVYVPPLIIQPYVENAIWHGLLHKETAGHLSIHLTRKAKTLLECVIEDDGVGREKAKELKSKSASSSKSLGMKLTESRLALLNKYAQWDAVVEITDLKNDAGEATGTRVILRIPVDA